MIINLVEALTTIFWKVFRLIYLKPGYVGDPSFLETLARTVTDLRTKNPNIKYVCDPVMGDNGHFYVPEVNILI